MSSALADAEWAQIMIKDVLDKGVTTRDSTKATLPFQVGLRCDTLSKRLPHDHSIDAKSVFRRVDQGMLGNWAFRSEIFLLVWMFLFLFCFCFFFPAFLSTFLSTFFLLSFLLSFRLSFLLSFPFLFLFFKGFETFFDNFPSLSSLLACLLACLLALFAVAGTTWSRNCLKPEEKLTNRSLRTFFEETLACLFACLFAFLRARFFVGLFACLFACLPAFSRFERTFNLFSGGLGCQMLQGAWAMVLGAAAFARF